MKNTIALLGAVAMTALSATTLAAAVTQKSVIGASDHPVYTVKVRGTDNGVYICKPETSTNSKGQTIRDCVREDSLAALLASGTGIAAGGAVAAGLAVAMVVNNNGSSSTTTTGN